MSRRKGSPLKIGIAHMVEITPEELARAILRLEPEEFAEVWFKFAELIEPDETGQDLMDRLGKAMGTYSGSIRMEPFKKILAHAEHYFILSRSK